jgi:flavin-dependent dehydrogenase
MSAIPKTTQVLVIGGGPGGSTAATLLARNGFKVTLLEQARFPRYHIGESLLPSILPILDLLGIREEFETHGFQKKLGAFLEWGSEKWPLNFGELSGDRTYAFQVVRSDFDQLLLEHARSQGVTAIEGVEVRSLSFEGDRPTSATWLQKMESGGGRGLQGKISFEYLIDASGRNGILSNHYLDNRRYHEVFKNIAVWGYWENFDRLGTGRLGDIAVGSISDGWLWGIPLHDNTMSVGVVMHKDALAEKRSCGLDEIYRQAIEASPLISKILSTARLVGPLKTETDYSYTAERFSGPGYFIVGDAACFLDPLLSSGVHLATFSAMLAAASITSVREGEIDEDEAINFFEKGYRQAYLRFLVFLSAFYDINRGKESYFWEAQRLTEHDVDSQNLKQAFLRLVTGLKDLSDAQTDTHHLVLKSMSERIGENLNFRKDKEALASLEGEKLDEVRDNAQFFSSVEGLFALNEEEAIDGLYVSTAPKLRVSRVK